MNWRERLQSWRLKRRFKREADDSQERRDYEAYIKTVYPFLDDLTEKGFSWEVARNPESDGLDTLIIKRGSDDATTKEKYY